MAINWTRVETRHLSTLDTDPEKHFTRVEARAVMQNADVERRFTRAEARVLALNPSLATPSEQAFLVTKVEARVLLSITPNFRWIDMFVDELFPQDVSFNSIGATKYATDVIMVDSGHDARQQRWDQPLMEYDVAYGVRTMDHLHSLIQFFRAMRGRKHSFKYHDHADYKSTFQTRDDGRGIPDIAFTDQVLGEGDHQTKVFQLRKEYATPLATESTWRTIYKPKPDSVIIGLNGVQNYNWTCDHLTGLVTFTSPHIFTGVSLTLAHPGPWTITGAVGQFAANEEGPAIVPGDKIVMSGWANAANNNSEDEVDTVRVLFVSGDYSTLTLDDIPDGFGVAEGPTTVTLYIHPAPKVGVEITAGFHFYVPVRFDTDRLPVSLEEYGVGGAADVKLIEVRPHAE